MIKHNLITIIGVFFYLCGFSQNEETLIVGSYNIRYLNVHDGENSWENRKDEVNSLIHFYDFDILGVQEAVHVQVEDVGRLSQYSYYGRGRDDGKQAGEYCAIYFKNEKFRLIDSGDFWLSETPDVPGLGWDAPHNIRICSWVKLENINTKNTFYFFNVHFDHMGREAQRQSGYLMVSKIKEIAKDAPVILTGDFNSRPDTEQIQHIQTLLKDSYSVTKTPPFGPVGTSNGFRYDGEFRNRIDYIFVSNDIDVLKYGVLNNSYNKRFPSDHFPVLSEIIINY